MENQQKYPRKVISILVENHYGVLARISSMFNRRSFNIDSIAASETIDPEITRITITVHVDENMLKQMLLQTRRLEEVREAFVLDGDSLNLAVYNPNGRMRALLAALAQSEGLFWRPAAF